MLYRGSNPAPFITTKNGLPLESSKKREVESVYKNIYLKRIFLNTTVATLFYNLEKYDCCNTSIAN